MKRRGFFGIRAQRHLTEPGHVYAVVLAGRKTSSSSVCGAAWVCVQLFSMD